MNGQFLEIAQDPRVVPGVHRYCDEWCGYCPVTTRCLVFRCEELLRAERGRKKEEGTFATMEEAIEFTRQISAIEGTRTDELDELLAHPPGESGVRTEDPLADRALEYAVRTELALLPVALRLGSRRPSQPPAVPSAAEVVMWYHARIYTKIFRALVSAASDCAAGPRGEDARGCAKLAMVSIERSRLALQVLRRTTRPDLIDPLIALLSDLDRDLEERFPEARGFVRVGLDCPIA